MFKFINIREGEYANNRPRGAAGLKQGSALEPELTPRCRELLLLRRALQRGLRERCDYRGTRKEIDVHAPPLAVSELDKARSSAVVRPRCTRFAQTDDEMLGHGAAGAFGEDPGLGHRRTGHIADRVDVRETRREVCLIDRDPAVDGEAGRPDNGGDAMDWNAEEKVVRQGASIAQVRRLRRR